MPVAAGLRALSNTMRVWDWGNAGPAKGSSLTEPQPVFGGREEQAARMLFPRNGLKSSDGPEPARCESLEVLDPPPFRPVLIWQSPAVAGATALQFAPEPKVAVPPAPALQLEPSACVAADSKSEPESPIYADLQPFPVQLRPFLVEPPATKASAEDAAPAFQAPATALPNWVAPAVEQIGESGQSLSFCGLKRIEYQPSQSWTLPPLSLLSIEVDPQVTDFQFGPQPTALPGPIELTPIAEPDYALHLAPPRPMALVLLPRSVSNTQPLPHVRSYWPWPSAATTVGKPVLGVMDFEMDPAVLKAVEPPKALVLAQRPELMVRPEPPAPEAEPEILIPIVESATPPMARLVPLPRVGMLPRSVFLRPGRIAPAPEFPLGEPCVPQRRSARLIPSPIYADGARKTSFFSKSSPGWIITALIALLIPIGALGVVNYWILPAHRASAASTPSQGPAPSTGEGAAATATPGDALPANWKKVVEITGIRLQDGRAQYIVVNHGKAPIPSTTVLVTLRSASAAAKGLPPVGSFQVRLAPLAPKESREMSSAIQMAPVSNTGGDSDWTDIRAELQLVK